MKRKTHKYGLFFMASFVVGLLLMTQFRSFDAVQGVFVRERNPNIFSDIQILKQVTDDLEEEIEKMQERKNNLSNVSSGIKALDEEKKKYLLLSGEVPVSGSGIALSFSDILDTFWFTDFINEVATAGAEAISINGVRVTSQNSGFRVLPPYTLIVGNQTLYGPFTIEVIGDPAILYDALRQSGGFIERIQKSMRGLNVELGRRDQIVMNPR